LNQEKPKWLLQVYGTTSELKVIRLNNKCEAGAVVKCKDKKSTPRAESRVSTEWRGFISVSICYPTLYFEGNDITNITKVGVGSFKASARHGRAFWTKSDNDEMGYTLFLPTHSTL